jgi:hypothetical protein
MIRIWRFDVSTTGRAAHILARDQICLTTFIGMTGRAILVMS